MSESVGCCRCCCGFILTLGLTALFMWLSLRTSNPTSSIQEFYLPSLNKSLNTPKNTTLFFQVRLDNPNKDKGIFYDPVNITFSNQSHLIGHYTIPGFYQGHKKKAKKYGSFEARGVDREVVFANGTAVFRVDLVTAVRFKIIAWKTKRNKIKVRADLLVNDQGTKVNHKGVKLKSMAPTQGSRYELVGSLVNLFALVFLNFW